MWGSSKTMELWRWSAVNWDSLTFSSSSRPNLKVTWVTRQHKSALSHNTLIFAFMMGKYSITSKNSESPCVSLLCHNYEEYNWFYTLCYFTVISCQEGAYMYLKLEVETNLGQHSWNILVELSYYAPSKNILIDQIGKLSHS